MSLENSQISGNDNGLNVSDQAQVTIINSKISSNDLNGIDIWRSASVSIQNTIISSNEWSAIMIRKEATATVELSGNRFLDNKECGIWSFSEKAHVQGPPQEMYGNGADLCGFVPSSLRKLLTSQTSRTHVSVPEDYPSLQEAIDAVAPGGTIEVAAGTFEGGLTIWKPLTLRGAGREKTELKVLPGRELVIWLCRKP